MSLYRIILAVTSFLSYGNSIAASLQAIDVKTSANKTSVFCVISQEPNYKAFVLSSPNRAIIDIENTSLQVNVDKVSLGKSVIEHLRTGSLPRNSLRLVFDVKQPVDIKVHQWQPREKALHGLRIDLIEEARSNAIIPAIKKFNNELRDVVVVIDPGHGGKDPGAIGARHYTEKNVVLEIARKLKQEVDAQPGMRAVLTRDGDYFISLRKRLTIARKHNADIFVSIHADAFANRESNGASVYALSPIGATSEAARWLAEKENYSELGGVDLSDLKDESGLLRSVLIDLSQTATISSSLQMGEFVLKYLDELTNLHHDRVEQARFVVLKSPDIPSILVETGFISNLREEKNLVSPAYQKRLTGSILKGIKHYFSDYPPHGTIIEATSSTKIHYVQRGESITTIADKYNTTVSAIKAKNGLSRLNLRVGQKINIPESTA